MHICGTRPQWVKATWWMFFITHCSTLGCYSLYWGHTDLLVCAVDFLTQVQFHYARSSQGMVFPFQVFLWILDTSVNFFSKTCNLLETGFLGHLGLNPGTRLPPLRYFSPIRNSMQLCNAFVHNIFSWSQVNFAHHDNNTVVTYATFHCDLLSTF